MILLTHTPIFLLSYTFYDCFILHLTKKQMHLFTSKFHLNLNGWSFFLLILGFYWNGEIHVNCIWSFLRTVDDASKIRMFICKNNNKNKNSSQCSTDLFIASFNIVLLSKMWMKCLFLYRIFKDEFLNRPPLKLSSKMFFSIY